MRATTLPSPTIASHLSVSMKSQWQESLGMQAVKRSLVGNRAVKDKEWIWGVHFENSWLNNMIKGKKKSCIII